MFKINTPGTFFFWPTRRKTDFIAFSLERTDKTDKIYKRNVKHWASRNEVK